MINRSHRFHGYGSLKYVYRNGRTARGPLFAIKTVPNPRRSSYRLAVVVSRKVNKSAVARNRMRRRLYEAMRQVEQELPSPHDIVLTVFHDDVMREPYDKLSTQLRKLLRQAGIL